MQSTTSICSFMRSHMNSIRVGARLVLLIYLCFPVHYGFTRYMNFFVDEYPTLIFFPLQFTVLCFFCRFNFCCNVETSTQLQIKKFSEKII